MKSKLIMETTNLKSATRKWCRFRESRTINSDVCWIFTDGSSTGWYAAVVIIDGITIRRASAWKETGSTRNVGAELRALVLGLQFAPKGRECAIVSDYLGVGAWMINAWSIKNEDVRALIDRARQIIETRQLRVNFIHHGGHQRDDSDFTYWNNEADRLCAPPLQRLGKKGFYDEV